MSEKEEIQAAIETLQEMKAQEDNYKQLRTEAELKLANLLGGEEGKDKTYDVDEFKVTIKRPHNVSINLDEYDKIESKLPEECKPILVKRSLDKTILKAIQKANVTSYELLAKCLEKKPGKVSASVRVA